MKYIFIVGAPGSKWSSVARNIYSSASIDRTDSTETRNYVDPAGSVNHVGAYWDPGMEFGTWFDCINQHTPEECEQEFDRPFSGTGVRIIKSHVLSNHIDFLQATWPNAPIVTVYRPNADCMSWWKQAGGWGIAYPDYRPYYQNDEVMYSRIVEQNRNIKEHTGTVLHNNMQLANLLQLDPPMYLQDYAAHQIEVTLL